PIEKLCIVFKTSQNGLSSSQAKERLKKNGPNVVFEKKTIPPFLKILFSQFENWLVIALILAATLSFFLGERLDALIVILIVIVSVFLGFIQEYRAEVALKKLKKFISNRIYVKRDERWEEIDSKDIVVGDLVRLQMVNLVPADIRLLVAKNLSVDESSLTGESFPVEKTSARLVEGDSLLPQDIKNMVFMGTSVVGGYGEGIAVAVGNDTFFGKTAFYLEKSAPETDFEKQTRVFSAFLFRVIILMASFVFLVNFLSGKGTIDSFLFAVALAVGITPELLPAIMTITLSEGALKMARKKVVVKRLMSVENFGNMDTLCTDKTGTLTEGIFTLMDYVYPNGERREEVLIKSILCTTNFFYGEDTRSTNPIDQAIWNSSKLADLKSRLDNYQFLDQVEFSFKTRRMITLVKDKKGSNLLIIKGSPESVLSVCNISSQEKKSFFERIGEYEKDGFRVIAVAQRLVNKETIGEGEIGNFSFLGFLLFSDPIKIGVKDTLGIFRKLGVQIKILSGDSVVITRSIANKVGLDVKDEDIITGEMLEKLSEDQFEEYARNYNFFARVTPEIKYRIVASLNKEGHIVGFLGDGVNDAPA
ncbi:MAG: cation-translocating P-type ATPase, partial [Microgenomates group bacterium]